MAIQPLSRSKVQALVLFAAVFVIFKASDSSSAATLYINSATTEATSTQNGTEAHPFKWFFQGYASSSPGDIIDVVGTISWANSAENSSSTSGFNINKNLTIQGHGPDQTVFQAANADDTAVRRVFTLASGYTFTINSSTVRYGKVGASGGCILASANSTLNINNSEVYNCRNSGTSYGGAIYGAGALNVYGTTFYGNVSNYSGGGIAHGSAVTTTITNSTFFQNSVTMGSSGGGGLHTTSGSTGNVVLTNVTMSLNYGNYGGAINEYGTGVIYARNCLLTANSGGSGSITVYRMSGTFTSNGYNVISAYTFTTSTGDWYDFSGTGIHTLAGTAVTGTISMDTGGSINDNNIFRTRTVALLSGVGQNNATTTSHLGVTIPTSDQRGAGRNGGTDIGSFEFDGSGLSVSAPTTEASNISFSSVEYDRMRIRWTNGNGARRIVFMKQASSGTAVPVNGVRYTAPTSTTATTTFGLGEQIGSSGWYAIFDGTNATSTGVTGLAAGSDYLVQIFEYNGVNTGASIYSAGAAAQQTTYAPVTWYVNSASGNDTTGNGSTGNPWKTFTKGYSSSTRGDTLDLTGTFTWSDTAETGDVITNGYSIAKDLIIQGQGAALTVFQPTSTFNSANQRVFTVETGVSTTIKNLTIRYGKQSGGYGGGISGSSNTVINLKNVDLYSCSTTVSIGYGGGIYAYGVLNIENSVIHDNYSTYSGGGVAIYGSSTSTVVNSTMYGNYVNSGSSGGGAIHTNNNANLILINNTFTGNYGNYGGALSQYSTGVTYLRNNIFALNNSGEIYVMSGSVVSRGYNIIRNYSFTTSTGDWNDTDNNGIFNYQGASSPTGTLNLDTSANINSSTAGLRTYAILSGSIAINRGTTTALFGVNIPSADQRGAIRSGSTDVGAYEYGGILSDAHTIAYSALSGGTISGTAVQTVADGGSTGVVTAVPNTGYSFVSWNDGLTSTSRSETNVTTSTTYTASFATNTYTVVYSAGSGGSISGSSTQIVFHGSSTTAVLAVPNTGYLFTSWNDGVTGTSRFEAGVTSTRTITANFTLNTSTVILTGVSSSPSTSSVSISWISNQLASSRAVYGLSASYASSTPITDLSPRVLSHTVSVSGLVPCAIYHYAVISENATGAIATSTDSAFTTSGCDGNAEVISYTSTNATSSGKTVTSTQNNSDITVVIPANFSATSTDIVIQIKAVSSTVITASLGKPSGYNSIGSVAFDVKALINENTTLDSFALPVTITLSYLDSEVSGIQISTLWGYHYHGGAWTPLNNCARDTITRTVACSVSSFSIFGLFGQPVAAAPASISSGGPALVFSVPPRVNKVPFCKNNEIISDVSQAYQIGVSRNKNFSGSSWEKYTAKYSVKSNPASWFVKYRSAEGGESEIYEICGARKTNTTTIKNIDFKRDLKLGSRGEDVRALQKYLNSAGYIVQNYGAGSPGNETVNFGIMTQRALINFQKANNIYPSKGYFGKITRGKIIN